MVEITSVKQVLTIWGLIIVLSFILVAACVPVLGRWERERELREQGQSKKKTSKKKTS